MICEHSPYHNKQQKAISRDDRLSGTLARRAMAVERPSHTVKSPGSAGWRGGHAKGLGLIPCFGMARRACEGLGLSTMLDRHPHAPPHKSLGSALGCAR